MLVQVPPKEPLPTLDEPLGATPTAAAAAAEPAVVLPPGVEPLVLWEPPAGEEGQPVRVDDMLTQVRPACDGDHRGWRHRTIHVAAHHATCRGDMPVVGCGETCAATCCCLWTAPGLRTQWAPVCPPPLPCRSFCAPTSARAWPSCLSASVACASLTAKVGRRGKRQRELAG